MANTSSRLFHEGTFDQKKLAAIVWAEQVDCDFFGQHAIPHIANQLRAQARAALLETVSAIDNERALAALLGTAWAPLESAERAVDLEFGYRCINDGRVTFGNGQMTRIGHLVTHFWNSR